MSLTREDAESIKNHLLEEFKEQGVSVGLKPPKEPGGDWGVAVRLREKAQGDIAEKIMSSAKQFTEKELEKTLDTAEIEIAHTGLGRFQ